MKSYTDIKQSRKLAEFLPLDSADGFWEYHDKWYSEGEEWEGYEDYPRAEPYLEYTRKDNEWKEDKSDVPCWSLAALLDALRIYTTKSCFNTDYISIPVLIKTENGYSITYDGDFKITETEKIKETDNYGWETPIKIVANNSIDACVEMILKLKKNNLL